MLLGAQVCDQNSKTFMQVEDLAQHGCNQLTHFL